MDTGIFTRGSPRERSCHGQQGPQINETKYLQAVIKTTVVTTNAMTVKVETSGTHVGIRQRCRVGK